MLFDLRPYETTVGHVSIYYDAGGMFDVEVNAGRYLAKDWGVTTTISRQFSNGWGKGHAHLLMFLLKNLVRVHSIREFTLHSY